jgi:low temperature requirement protein LtrA
LPERRGGPTITGMPSLRPALLSRPTSEDHRVTTLELFFDLVFVFAITQVTAFVAADLTAAGALKGALLVVLLWQAWASFSWLGNQAQADEGVVRLGLVLAMGGLFVVALAIPESFGDEGGGLSAPLALALALSWVRFVHLASYAVAADGDRALLRQLRTTAVPIVAAWGLLVAGALVGGEAQVVLWLLAGVVDGIAYYLGDTSAWQLTSPGHFAERHGLIVIIAVGESIVAIGVGVTDLPLTGAVVLAALLGLAVSVALWWTYFDVVAIVAERVLAGKEGVERARLARDSYSYLHLPMVAAIIFVAVGMKKVMSYVADTEGHDLSDPLKGIPLGLLYGGAAVYLLAHIAFRLRNVGTLNRPRLGVALALLPLGGLAAGLPALAALGLLAAVLLGLVAFEALRFAEARDKIRHEGHGPHGPAAHQVS